MTPDLMKALAISGGIMIAVVVLIIIIAIVTVKRGEVAMVEGAKSHDGASRH